jgi:hypothetical protein
MTDTIITVNPNYSSHDEETSSADDESEEVNDFTDPDLAWPTLGNLKNILIRTQESPFSVEV